MAQILDLGKFRFDFKGVYNPITEYERNDVVQYGGNVYVYTLGTASTGNLPTNTAFWSLMLEGFNYRATWSESTDYKLADVVSYGGKVYIALQDGTNKNPVTEGSYWSVLVDGIQYEGAWSSATSYQKGDVVKYGGNIFIATTNSVANVPSTGGGSWELLVYGVEFKGAYNDSTAYKINDIVSYGGKSYICILGATGNEPAANPSNWAIFSSGFQWEGVWSSLTNYQAGDVVNYGGLVYVATADSLNSAPTDPLYWAVLIEGIAWKGSYNALATYNKNDIVSYGGSSWIAKQNTTGNSPTVGANWDTLAAGTFPDYAAAAGKFLSNDGTQVLWVSDVTVDTLTANDQAFIGTDAEVKHDDKALTNAVAVFSFDNGAEEDGFAQIAFTNSDRTSSTDIQVIANNGDDSTGWASFGVTGSDFSDLNYGITGPNDAYIFFDAPVTVTKTITNKALTNNVATLTTGTAHGISVGAKAVITGVDATFNGTYYVTAVPTTTTFSYAKTATNVTSAAVSPAGSVTFNAGAGGSLVFATGENGTDNKIVFAAGGFATGDTQMEITPGVNVHIEIPTPSTSPTTGALTVVGGVGIQGDMNIQGNVAIVGTISFGGSGTTVTTQNLAVSDPIIFSGTNNTDDLVDLGIVGEYTVPVTNVVTSVNTKALSANVATLTTTTSHGYSIGDVVVVSGVDTTFNGTFVITAVTSSTFSYAREATNVSSAAVSPTGTATKTRERRWRGMVRDASDGVTKLFAGSTAKPGTTVDFTNAGLSYSALQTGSITATTVTSSGGITSTSAANSLSDLTLSGSSSSFGGTIAGSATFSGNPTFSGTPVFSGAPSFTGNPTFSGSPVFTGGIRVQEMIEDVVDVSHTANSVTLDYSTGNIFWLTNTLTGNATLAMTNVPTVDGRITTVNFIVTQGGTGYIPSNLTINGSAATIKWAQGLTPAPTSSSGKIDIFSFSVLRRSGAYTVFASINANY
jgi:hypothetical protein